MAAAGRKWYLLFDDKCSLCRSLAVRVHHLSSHRIGLMPLGSEAARSLLERSGHRPNTWFLAEVRDGNARLFSGGLALLKLAKFLGPLNGLRLLTSSMESVTSPSKPCCGQRSINLLLQSDPSRRRFLRALVTGGTALILTMAGLPPLSESASSSQTVAKRKTLEKIRIRKYLDLDSKEARQGEVIDLNEIKPERTDATTSSSSETLFDKNIGKARLLIIKTNINVSKPKEEKYEVITLGYVSKDENAEVAVITRGLSVNGVLKDVNTLAVYEPLDGSYQETYGDGYSGTSPSLVQKYVALAEELDQLEPTFQRIGEHLRVLASAISRENLDFQLEGHWGCYAIDSPNLWGCFWCVVCAAGCAACIYACVQSFQWWACILCGLGCIGCYCPCYDCIYEKCPGPPCC